MKPSIRFQTNLDEAKRDVDNMSWPWSEPPRIGESLVFWFDRDGERFCYDLKVVNVSYHHQGKHVVVELHMPQHFMSIKDWMEYMRRHREGRE